MSASFDDLLKGLGAKRSGANWVARCPSHEDGSPSLSIRESGLKTLFHCMAGCDQSAVMAALKDRGLWGGKDFGGPRPPVAQRADSVSELERIDRAREIWRNARSAPGTVVETYLRTRAIDLPIPPTLRFIEDAYHVEAGEALPALLAAVSVWPSQQVTAVQRIFLRRDGTGKADVTPAKKSLGPIRNGAVRLAKVGDRLGLAEGIEDALSAMQLDPSLPCWATLGTANLAHVVLPALPLAAEIVIIADNDPPGLKAAKEAAKRFVTEGRTVRIATPPAGTKDFNEMLQRERTRGAA